MDFEFIRDYVPLYVEAAGMTLRISFLGILLSTAIGLLCSLVKIFKIPVLRNFVNGYIEVSRNTPLLIQLFFLYFGLPKIGLVLSSESCAITGLAFLGGSYMAEAFRTGIDQVPAIQSESGLSLGLTGWQVFRYIILPQAITTSVLYSVPTLYFL